ncbi:MAG: hypothetical protein AAF960_01260 [Bacteroidota bacterium]
MKKKERFLVFGSFLSHLLILFACHQKPETMPESYYNFPIDTTVQILYSLPSDVRETSGIITFESSIWTHNDSGDDPTIYELSIADGTILRQVTLSDATARDWEDIGQDSQYIYVSDLGNNGGKRQDLAIWKIAKSEVMDGDETATSFKINVTYPDRTDFKPPAYQHNFDCEALLAFEDSLYVFSKNHLDKQCRFYSLANNSATPTVYLQDSFDTKGMVTGASMDKENGVLALVGYNLDPALSNFGPFVWLFWDYPNRDFFAGKSRRINMPFIAQMEGISYWKEGKFLISSERSRYFEGKLAVFDAMQWLE